MFLNDGSISRPPPSLLPGSVRLRSPAFSRYYEAAKTTVLILRHFVCSVVPQYLGSISCFRSSSRGNRRANARVLFDRCHPLPSGVFSQGRLRFSQVPCEPLMHLPCSQTPAGPPRQANCGVSVLPSHKQTSKAPTITGLSKLNHTAFALTVYASCRPLGRRRKTRFRSLAKLFRTGLALLHRGQKILLASSSPKLSAMRQIVDPIAMRRARGDWENLLRDRPGATGAVGPAQIKTFIDFLERGPDARPARAPCRRGHP